MDTINRSIGISLDFSGENVPEKLRQQYSKTQGLDHCDVLITTDAGEKRMTYEEFVAKLTA